MLAILFSNQIKAKKKTADKDNNSLFYVGFFVFKNNRHKIHYIIATNQNGHFKNTRELEV